MKYVFYIAIKYYYRIFFKVQVFNIEKLPQKGSYMICCNHINFQDPLIIGTNIKRFIAAMGKKELFKYKITSWFFRTNGAFPVDRDANDISAIKTSIKVLKNGTPLLIFPEGTRNNTKKPLEVKPGIAMIAIKAKVPVVPITIDSDYKFFKKIKLIIGDQINLEKMYDKKVSSEEYQNISQDIINKIYEKME